MVSIFTILHLSNVNRVVIDSPFSSHDIYTYMKHSYKRAILCRIYGIQLNVNARSIRSALKLRQNTQNLSFNSFHVLKRVSLQTSTTSSSMSNCDVEDPEFVPGVPLDATKRFSAPLP